MAVKSEAVPAELAVENLAVERLAAEKLAAEKLVPEKLAAVTVLRLPFAETANETSGRDALASAAWPWSQVTRGVRPMLGSLRMSTMDAAVVLHSRAAGVPLMMLAFSGIPISAPGLKSAQVLAATILAVEEVHLQLEQSPALAERSPTP
mmetsp:Transcript_112081/g.205693  ORF Transcript_112081/g.205693 Transcript_112081/m.205693 type:complete len:150 (+) Transcript_112081:211-660(+)